MKPTIFLFIYSTQGCATISVYVLGFLQPVHIYYSLSLFILRRGLGRDWRTIL